MSGLDLDSLVDMFNKAKTMYERNGNGRTIHLYYNKVASVATAFNNYRHMMASGKASGGDIERARILLVDNLTNFITWVGQQVG